MGRGNSAWRLRSWRKRDRVGCGPPRVRDAFRGDFFGPNDSKATRPRRLPTGSCGRRGRRQNDHAVRPKASTPPPVLSLAEDAGKARRERLGCLFTRSRLAGKLYPRGSPRARSPWPTKETFPSRRIALSSRNCTSGRGQRPVWCAVELRRGPSAQTRLYRQVPHGIKGDAKPLRVQHADPATNELGAK